MLSPGSNNGDDDNANGGISHRHRCSASNVRLVVIFICVAAIMSYFHLLSPYFLKGISRSYSAVSKEAPTAAPANTDPPKETASSGKGSNNTNTTTTKLAGPENTAAAAKAAGDGTSTSREVAGSTGETATVAAASTDNGPPKRPAVSEKDLPLPPEPTDGTLPGGTPTTNDKSNNETAKPTNTAAPKTDAATSPSPAAPANRMQPGKNGSACARENGSGNSSKESKADPDIPFKWTQVFTNETQDCSDLLFEHCCVGQCRQSAFKMNGTTALWKSNHNLANLTDVLNYYGGNIQRNQSLPCTILFVGDSLSSDHSMAANCQLMNSGYELISCNPRIGLKLYGSDSLVQCKTNIYPSMPHFLLQNNVTEFCKEVLVVWVFGIPLLDSYMKLLKENNGVVLFNWGVHCNNKRTCLSPILSKGILPLVRGPNSNEYAKWRFLFRETEPQHFGTDGGNFVSGSGARKCTPINVKYSESNNWRNKEVEMFLSEQNLTDRIKTVRLHDALLPLWQLHYGNGDCTHYCYDPYRFDVTWDGLLKALLP